MYQTKPPVANSVLLVELFEIVEKHVIRFVADRMNRYLQTRPVGIEHVLEKLAFDEVSLFIHHKRPPLAVVGWIVRVSTKEARGACSHDAVYVTLERAQSNPLVSRTNLDSPIGPFLPTIETRPQVKSNREPARVA